MDNNLTSSAGAAQTPADTTASTDSESASLNLGSGLTFNANIDFFSDEVFNRGINRMSPDEFKALTAETQAAAMRPSIKTDPVTGKTEFNVPHGANQHIARQFHKAQEEGGFTEDMWYAMMYRTAESIARHNDNLSDTDLKKMMNEGTQIDGMHTQIFQNQENPEEYYENERQGIINLVVDTRKYKFGDRVKNHIERQMAEGKYANDFDLEHAYTYGVDYTRANISNDKWNAEMKSLKNNEWKRYEQQFREEEGVYPPKDGKEDTNAVMMQFATWFVKKGGILDKRREAFGKALKDYGIHLSLQAISEERMRTGKQDWNKEIGIVDRVMSRENIIKAAKELADAGGSWEEATERNRTVLARRFAQLESETAGTMKDLQEAGKKDTEEADAAKEAAEEKQKYEDSRAAEVKKLERDAEYDAAHKDELIHKEELKARAKIEEETIKAEMEAANPFLVENKYETILSKKILKDEEDQPVMRVPEAMYKQILKTHKARPGQGVEVIVNGDDSRPVLVRPMKDLKRVEWNWTGWCQVNEFNGGQTPAWIKSRIKKRHKMKFKIR